MTNSIVNLAQNASASSAAPSSGCLFCGKKGLLILPVRYTCVRKSAGAPALPGHLGQHVKDIALTQSAYAVRTARAAFIYALVNRKGALSWQCYASTDGGYVAQFAADSPPVVPPEFTCEPNTCGHNASMIAIDKADEVPAVYLLLTPDPLTTATLNRLKSIQQAEALCSKGQMVKFSPSAWQAGSRNQPHCLDAAATGTTVAEFVLAKKNTGMFTSELGKALCNSAFPLMSSGPAEFDPRYMAAVNLSRLESLQRYMTAQNAVAVALFDPIGIVQELNDFRNDAHNRVDNFLNTPDAHNVTNRWKFDTLQGIREVKVGFENGLANDTLLDERQQELDLYAKNLPIFPDDPPEMRKRKMGFNNAYTHPDRKAWAAQNPQKATALRAQVDKLRSERPARLARARAEAQKRWETKYAKLLDAKAMAQFDAEFDTVGAAALEVATARVDDHLAWVLHERFVAAFDFYDRNNEVSGFQFEAQAALCTVGMVGCEKSAAQVDAWLNAPATERKNIYMRGLLLNQEAIEKEAATALANAAAVAAAAPSAAMIPGDKMYKALKGLIDFFRKADSAWDEYVREGTKSGNERNAGLHKTKEGAVLFKMSELNRSVFRRGITGFEKKAVGFFGGLVFARMGALAEKLRFEELMYGFNPEKPHIDPKTKNPYPPGQEPSKNKPTGIDPALARDAAKDAADEAEAARKKMMTVAQYRDMQRRNGVTFTAEEYLRRNSHMTSNYHQARIGGLLAVMETFALAGKLHDIYKKGGGSSIEYWEAGANLLSVASITLDIGYSLAKSARETATDTAARGAGDIVRGGLKLWAGGFAAMAGGIGLYVDFGKLREERNEANRTPQKALLFMRIGVGIWNTTFGAAAAASYAGPVLRRIVVNLSEDALRRRATVTALAKGAEWLGARVFLLRLVAWGTGAGLVLTAAEIGYYIYLYYQPNALEVWLKRSAFRDRSLGGNAFPTIDGELEELAKARQLVGV